MAVEGKTEAGHRQKRKGGWQPQRGWTDIISRVTSLG